MDNKRYFETVALCTGAQHKRDIPNWTTIHDFDGISNNKDFDASVFKQGNRLVIAFAGTNPKRKDDIQNDIDIYLERIPEQYYEAVKLYNAVQSDNRYRGCNIEFVGYSLGGSISNLMSHKTGLPSHAIAPIGSKDIALANKNQFKFDDSNITTYGRKGDIAFNSALSFGRQSGKIVILPTLNKHEVGNDGVAKGNHYLHNFGKGDLSEAYIYENKSISPLFNASEKLGFTPKKTDIASFAGWKNPITGSPQIYTQEDINGMSKDEITKKWNEINWQAKKIGIPTIEETKQGMLMYGNTVHVKAYTRADGTYVRSYVRSK